MSAVLVVSPRLARAVLTVWSQIAPDITWGPMDEETNESAIECVLDADRMNPSMGFNDDPQAWQELCTLKVQFGYRAVNAALAAHPSLQLI